MKDSKLNAVEVEWEDKGGNKVEKSGVTNPFLIDVVKHSKKTQTGLTLRHNLRDGVVVTRIAQDGIFASTRLMPGHVIQKVNDVDCTQLSVKEIALLLVGAEGRIKIEVRPTLDGESCRSVGQSTRSDRSTSEASTRTEQLSENQLSCTFMGNVVEDSITAVTGDTGETDERDNTTKEDRHEEESTTREMSSTHEAGSPDRREENDAPKTEEAVVESRSKGDSPKTNEMELEIASQPTPNSIPKIAANTSESVSSEKKHFLLRRKLLKLGGSISRSRRSNKSDSSTIVTKEVQMVPIQVETPDDAVTLTVFKPTKKCKTGLFLKRKWDGTITVSKILPDGLVATTPLKPGDAIFSVNGMACHGISTKQVAGLVRETKGTLTIVARPSPNNTGLREGFFFAVSAQKPTPSTPAGLEIMSGEGGAFVIFQVCSDSLFSESTLRAGDELCSINGTDCRGMLLTEVAGLFGAVQGTITIVARRLGDSVLPKFAYIKVDEQHDQEALLESNASGAQENASPVNADPEVAAFSPMPRKPEDGVLDAEKEAPKGKTIHFNEETIVMNRNETEVSEDESDPSIDGTFVTTYTEWEQRRDDGPCSWIQTFFCGQPIIKIILPSPSSASDDDFTYITNTVAGDASVNHAVKKSICAC